MKRTDDSVARKTKLGLYWNLSVRIPYEVVHFGLSIVVARVLEPRDFGLVSVATMAILYSNTITNLGFNQALVQREEIQEDHINAVFTFDLLLSIGLTAILLLAASPIATFFRDPDIAWVIRALSAMFVLTAFHDLPYTLLRRDLEFKRIAIVDACGEIGMTIVALVLALMGFKYWALVWARLAAVCLTTTYLLYSVDWTPKIMRSFRPLKDLFDFGIWNVFGSQMAFFGSRIDRIVIGRSLGATTLGLYDKAKSLSQMPVDAIAANINTVLFSSVCRVQGNSAEVERVFRKGLVMLSVITFPVFLGISTVARYFVPLAFGEKWNSMISALEILCYAGILNSVNGLFSAVAIGTGQYRQYTKRLAATTCLIVIGSVLLVRFGMVPVAWMIVIASGVMGIQSFALIKGTLGLTWAFLGRCLVPATVASSCMMVVVKIVSATILNVVSLSSMAALVVIGLVCYVATLYLAPLPALDEIRKGLKDDWISLWNRSAGGAA